MNAYGTLCVLAVVCTLATTPPVPAQIVIETTPQPAVAGEPLIVRALDADESLAGIDVIAESRPASQLAEVETVGRLSTDGSLRFVPKRPGLVRLTLRDPADGRELARHDLAVHAPTVPIRAIVVLIVAGGLLFGGARVGLAARS